MSTVLKLFILFLATTVLHWAFMALLGGAGISLNSMLVLALAVCAFLKPGYGYPAAFICGLFLDFFGVKLFGAYALAFTLCACAMYELDKRLDFNGVIPQMIIVFALSLAVSLFHFVLLKTVAGFSAWNGFWPFAGSMLLNALLAPFIFWAVKQMCGKEVKAS